MQCTDKSNYDRSGLFIKTRYPCGKCLSCRTKERREWSSRLLLESRCWHNSLFFTLTYDEKHLPEDGLLSKRHIQTFIENWRNHNGHYPRYFVAGEYGPLHKRPHYHGIFFGEDPKVRYKDGKEETPIDIAWAKGFTDTKDFHTSEYQNSVVTYVAGYVLKNSFKPISERTHHLKEWSLKSRRPALGTGAVEKIVSALTTRHGAARLSRLQTAPARFKYGGKFWIMPYKIRKGICQELDLPFVPLNETLTMELDNGSVHYTPKPEKTFSEAVAAEKGLAEVLYRKTNKTKRT